MPMIPVMAVIVTAVMPVPVMLVMLVMLVVFIMSGRPVIAHGLIIIDARFRPHVNHVAEDFPYERLPLAPREIARIQDVRFIPFRQAEPVAMSAALQARDASELSEVRSLIVVADGFRSRRTHLIYSQVFEPRGVRVECVPVWGTRDPSNWTQTWHGIQEVVLQGMKLQYYRFWIL